ncbi:DNA repair ATPase [Streptomyces sp. BI20]|uniref:DNA repair ATPase n=1 Tax=Streptomyces sp. BI20 TaxID=3403460 RepID=UPI003C78BBA2
MGIQATTATDNGTDTPVGTDIDAGTYEVLRDRLDTQARELTRRARALDERRTETFGRLGLALTDTAPLRTPRPTVARDLVAVGDALLLGHAVPTGHTGPVTLPEVFTLLDPEGAELPADAVPGLLDCADAAREFEELFRYFRQARLLRLRLLDDLLLAVFRVGERAADVRALRWRLTGTGAGTRARFLDARGERDAARAAAGPAAEDEGVAWTATGREEHVPGRHPHVAIPGADLWVSTVGGSLTVKIENDVETERGIHAEPVAEPLQSLADAEIDHARVGPLVLLRVRPYKEDAYRHLVHNTVTRSVVRVDALGQGALRLPEDQGLVFPGGYVLADGTLRTFDVDTADLAPGRTAHAPNGEDLLFRFAAPDGRILLLPWNLIRREPATPITGLGHALLADGTLVVLRAPAAGADTATAAHPAQRWRSPFVSEEHAAAHPAGDGPLARIGNPDLVRGVADCLDLAETALRVAPGVELYTALTAACGRVRDRHHWLGDPEVGDLGSVLDSLGETVRQVLGEYETVRTLTRRAVEAVEEAEERTGALVRRIRGESPRGAAAWVANLTALRACQGRLLSLAELRYVDTGRLDALAERLTGDIEAAGRRAVEFLRRPEAFAPVHAELEALAEDAARITTAAEAGPVTEGLDERAAGLRAVTEVVGGLDIEDATVRTAILERIGEVLAGVNRVRAVLDGRRRSLVEGEARAAFDAEFALLGQAVTAGLGAAGDPEGCDTALAALLLQVEGLEARFGESPESFEALEARRFEIHEAFSARKQALQDELSRRADRLAASAGRILDTVARHLTELSDPDAVNTWFASDPMVAKVRRTVEDLRGLGDLVRAEELEGRLAALRQEAGRALRDRRDLYTEGGDALRLGAHAFAVDTRPRELSLVPDAAGPVFTLTGTDYRAPVADPEFAATRPYWGQSLPSETPGVYRAEYLAARLFAAHGEAGQGLPADPEALAELVRTAARDAYDEGYEAGVHDHDALLLLGALRRLAGAAGLLRFPAGRRAAARGFWARVPDAERRAALTRRARSLAAAREVFGPAVTFEELVAELAPGIAPFLAGDGGDGDGADGDAAAEAARYLVAELTAAEDAFGFVLAPGTAELLASFRALPAHPGFRADLAACAGDEEARRTLAAAWLRGHAGPGVDAGALAEAVAAELCVGVDAAPDRAAGAEVAVTTTVTGLLGAHPRIVDGALRLDLAEFLTRTDAFARDRVPGFRAYQRARTALTEAERERLRLEDHRPRVLSTFVRNRLIDEVFLPLFGSNLARQIGALGADKRTDSSGLLLLVSPPGYGKTTLVEYVAERLGMLLVKISGPALGHEVTSLDPDRAPDAASRREVEKINFALAAGNNTLLYLDDIQHTSPELLQKFIPLCDATRRIEGVWEGRPRTWDLRGKRFAVCMAGNPYTESGELFRVPDMLANRADVWNLGDVLTGKEEAFALSFVENALTAHPALAPLAGRDREDLDLLLAWAGGARPAPGERLSHPYAPAEVERITAVLRHLLVARDAVVAVNAAYIASAAQSDADRTEPPFRLQGSYRDMNKIAARLDPVMNRTEVDAVIADHYRAEAQTLTTGAEANLLKFGELRGTLTEVQAARWAEIKRTHVTGRRLGGAEDDPAVRAIAALGLLADRMAAVEDAIRARAALPRDPRVPYPPDRD